MNTSLLQPFGAWPVPAQTSEQPTTTTTKSTAADCVVRLTEKRPVMPSHLGTDAGRQSRLRLPARQAGCLCLPRDGEGGGQALAHQGLHVLGPGQHVLQPLVSLTVLAAVWGLGARHLIRSLCFLLLLLLLAGLLLKGLHLCLQLWSSAE